MASEVELARRALMLVGTRYDIASLAEASAEARAVSQIFASTRDELLGKARWNFARKTAVLSQSKTSVGASGAWTAALPPPPWRYAYTLPTDYIKAHFVEPLNYSASGVPIFSVPIVSSGSYMNGAAIPFMLAADGLLTDLASAALTYTYRVTDTTKWSPEFTEVFVLVLASKLVIPLTGDQRKALHFVQQANQALLDARVEDANEGLTVYDPVPMGISVRSA